jgi:hypothetical protein
MKKNDENEPNKRIRFNDDLNKTTMPRNASQVNKGISL